PHRGVSGEDGVLVVAAEERGLDLLALVLVGVVVHRAPSVYPAEIAVHDRQAGDEAVAESGPGPGGAGGRARTGRPGPARSFARGSRRPPSRARSRASGGTARESATRLGCGSAPARSRHRPRGAPPP